MQSSSFKQTAPTRTLSRQPDLEQLRRQAKELLAAFKQGVAEAVAEVNAHYHGADPATFALHDAQLVLARSYGYDSWPKLKAFVDGANVQRLTEAVSADDVPLVRALLKARPELATREIDNHDMLHFAVFNRSPAMVRLLMEHGALAHLGVYPHREATTPRVIATERGYDEIVAIIDEFERRRREEKSGVADAPSPDELFAAIGAGEDERAIALMDSNLALVDTCNGEGWTPLHLAARRLNEALALWLLDHGAAINAHTRRGATPLELAAHTSGASDAARFARIVEILIYRGAAMTPWAAAALGDTDWLRARHAEGAMENRIEDNGGMLRIAVSHEQADVLALLVGLGFDPDERKRLENTDEVEYTWGMPLWHAAGGAKYELAEILLDAGADPNAAVYASGDLVFQAYSQRDWEMVKLLERYGGIACATTPGLYRQTDLGKKMLAGEAPYRLDGVGGSTLHEQMLWGASCGGDAELLRLALAGVDWPRDDTRWFTAMEQPLRLWTHGNSEGWDRGTYQTCFRLILERCDPNLRGRPTDSGRFGLTILHSIAGSRNHMRAEERVAFATTALDAGARLDIRDNILKSTPLGWACRWGRVELVKLFLERGADAVEADAEVWATPRAWGEKMGWGRWWGCWRGIAPHERRGRFDSYKRIFATNVSHPLTCVQIFCPNDVASGACRGCYDKRIPKRKLMAGTTVDRVEYHIGRNGHNFQDSQRFQNIFGFQRIDTKFARRRDKGLLQNLCRQHALW